MKLSDLPELWPAQERQDKVKLEITVAGIPKWESLIDEKVGGLSDFWAELCGDTEVPLEQYLRAEARVNAVSFERCVLNTFLNRGYILEELEVEFSDPPRSKWGTCVWYKEHSLYLEPLGEMFGETDQKWAGFIRAMFKTEHAGDKEFTLFSMQMLSAALIGQPVNILLHKTLVFRKAVFSTPITVEKESVAA